MNVNFLNILHTASGAAQKLIGELPMQNDSKLTGAGEHVDQRKTLP